MGNEAMLDTIMAQLWKHAPTSESDAMQSSGYPEMLDDQPGWFLPDSISRLNVCYFFEARQIGLYLHCQTFPWTCDESHIWIQIWEELCKYRSIFVPPLDAVPSEEVPWEGFCSYCLLLENPAHSDQGKPMALDQKEACSTGSVAA